jgi:hypothetical protein
MLEHNSLKKARRQMHQDFVDDVIEDSEVIEVDKINPDSLRTAFWHLDGNAFRYEEAFIFTKDLAYEQVHGVPVKKANNIPDDTAIVLHPKAIAPSPPEVMKPAIIIHPEAIVTIKEKSAK